MKGVILSSNPTVRVIDLTHEISPQDIAGAAFTLLAAYRSFPAGTVHLAVVDPGVGSARRPILVMAGEQYFVGPDNGSFSYLFDREPDALVFHLTEQSYFHQPVSATFHGRDIFAPIAAALANGVEPEKLGVLISDPIRLDPLQPKRSGAGKLSGRILHIDRFGNCITNFTPGELTSESLERGARLTVNRKVIKSFKRFFSEEGGSRNQLFTIWGSAGFLEIAAQNRSAAKILRAERGQPVMARFG